MALPPLRIGVDAHALGARKTGNERFVLNLLRALPRVCNHEIVALVPDEAAAASLAGIDGIRTESFAPAHPLARHAWSLGAAARGLDVLLVQYAGPMRAPCPVVHVVHDASFVTHPEWFPPMERFWMQRLIPRSVRRGAEVITVSHTARDELVPALGLDPARVTVAYDGVDPVFTPDGPRREAAFLAVGAAGPRKNLGVVTEAIRRLRATGGPAIPLVHVGPDDPPADARPLGYLSDPDLAAWMRSAAALVYPSRYEGFGLPPVEAMASGTPALVADIPVTREVCGDAAMFLDPDDPNVWAAAMRRIVTDGALREGLRAAGLAHAAGYTWEASASIVVEVLERAAQTR